MTNAELTAETSKPSCRKCIYYEVKIYLQHHWPEYYPDALFKNRDGLCARKVWGKSMHNTHGVVPVDHTKAEDGCPHYSKGNKLWKDECARVAAVSEQQHFGCLEAYCE